MKRVTVVRQNRCDKELNVLLFGCFFIYFAMQLFIGQTEQLRLVNGVNMLLYLVFVPGFVFRIGYCFGTISKLKSEEQGKAQLGQMALCSYGFFFVLAFCQNLLILGYQVNIAVFRVLMLEEIPGISAIFFAMALMLLMARLFYDPLKSLAARPKLLFLTAAVFVLLACLRTEGEAYPIVAALTGADGQAAVPAVPYFAYFLFGIWCEENKPAFRWRIAGISAAVTVIGVLLYRTPAQDVGRMLLSAFPVYLIYVISEVLSDVTLRCYAARFVTDTVELVFAVYAMVLFLLRCTNSLEGAGVRQVLLLAFGMLAVLYGLILGFWVFSKAYEKAGIYFTKKVRHKTAAYFLIYTAAFVLLFGLAFLDFPRFGRTLLWRADGISQYYPRAVFFVDYIRDMIAQFLKGNFELPMYDFRLGLGGEITYSLEPLYFLFAFFGREHVEFAYVLLAALRFYLAGVTFSVFCLYFKKDYLTTFLAACVYVFCGFSLSGGTKHPMFMIPMIMLPLLILAIEEIIRKKRWYLCTIFVAVSLFSNYYFLYMSTLGMGVYFLVRFFCQKEKKDRSFRNFIGRGLTICGSYLLGVAMSCIVLVTTFGLYVGSGRNGAAVIKTPSLFYYSREWLLRCFLCFPTTANSPGEWLKLGFLPIAFFAVAVLFAKKGRKELKILSVIGVVFMAFPLFGFVFSGFSSVGNRWCYMLSMLAAFIVADCLPDMLTMEKKEKLVCVGALAVYGYILFFGGTTSTRYMKAAFLCLIATYIGLLLCQQRSTYVRYVAKQSILILMTFVMVFVNGHSLYSASGTVREYAGTGEAQRRAENTPLRAVSELGDESFYRVSTPKLDYSTISSSILFDYNSISMFNSTFNGSIMEYLERMGSTSYSVTQLFGMSNRAFLNALAAVKYYAYYEEPARALPYGYEQVLETEIDGRKTIVCENQYALPLGYTYQKSISRKELEEYDTLERQEVLMQCVMLENQEAQGTEGIETTLQPLEFSVSKENGLYLETHALTTKEPEASVTEEEMDAEPSNAEEEQEESDSLTVAFESLPDSETYLVLKNAVLEGDMSESAIQISFQNEGNKLTYKFRSDDDRYGSGQQDYVFNLGYHEEAITSCEIGFSRKGTIQFDAIEMYSQPMDNLPEYTKNLTEDVLENIEMETNQVSGTISLEEDKILVLSIPYQNGWTAYVDGEEVELQRANYTYMAIPLTAGDHTVRLEFAIPGVKYALVIMPSAAILFAVLLIIGRARKHRERKKAEKDEM